MGQVHPIDPIDTPDIATARRYSRDVQIACDDLHADPFSVPARAAMLTLIVDASPEADAALVRALAAMTH